MCSTLLLGHAVNDAMFGGLDRDRDQLNWPLLWMHVKRLIFNSEKNARRFLMSDVAW